MLLAKVEETGVEGLQKCDGEAWSQSEVSPVSPVVLSVSHTLKHTYTHTHTHSQHG